MTELTGDEPYTLKGYDMVVSLSSEAINSQLKELYDKPIPDGKPPPPPLSIAEYLPGPRPRHYINHKLCVVPDLDVNKKIKVDLGLGIVGHIKSPVVSFADRNTLDTLVFTITFETAPWTQEFDTAFGRTEAVAPTDGLSRSFFYFSDMEAKKQKVDISGWTMSWQVSVDSKEVDIQDLLAKCQDPSSPIAVPGSTEDKLKSIRSESFTATTIFCVCNYPTICQSFTVKDKDGKTPGDADGSAGHLLAKFLQKQSRTADGKPTPDHPFVLGYGLKAVPPKLSDVNEGLGRPGETPTYFRPRGIRLGTTVSEAASDKVYTAGTLNYLLQTYRNDPSSLPKIKPGSKTAGTFDSPLFADIKIPGFGLKGAHGVVVYSQQVMDMWLQSVIDQLAFPNLTDSLLTMFGKTACRDGYSSKDSDIPIDMARPTELGKPGGRRKGRALMQYAVTYTSDLEVDPAGAAKDGASRKTYIDIWSYCECDVEAWTLTKGLYAYDENKFYENHTRSQFRLSYSISPGEGGTWVVQLDKARSHLPEAEAVPTQLSSSFPASTPKELSEITLLGSTFGCFSWHVKPEQSTWDRLFGVARDGEDLREWMSDAAMKQHSNTMTTARTTTTLSDLSTRIGKIADSLKSAVILPAGNVFTFKNMDTAKDGRLYATLNWRTLSDVHRT